MIGYIRLYFIYKKKKLKMCIFLMFFLLKLFNFFYIELFRGIFNKNLCIWFLF